MMNAENDRWDNNNGHVSRNIQCQDFRGVDRQSRTGLIFLLMMNAENDRWDNNNGHVSRNIQCQ